MILNNAGKVVDAEWNRIPDRYKHVVLDKYQIMPNHFHGIVQIKSEGNGRNKTIGNGTVGTSLVGVLNDDGIFIGNGVNAVDEIIGNGTFPISSNPLRMIQSHHDQLQPLPEKHRRLQESWDSSILLLPNSLLLLWPFLQF